jgi:4-hydroxy-2-oxoglutarate aldolase
MLLHGIFPPITTPFYPDGNVYFKKLESNVERYSRTPAPASSCLARLARPSCFPTRSGAMC